MFEWFSGRQGEILSSSLNILIVSVMLAMSIRLLLHRRKLAYISLIVSFVLTIFCHLFSIYMASSGGAGSATIVTKDSLQAAGLCLLMLGFYLLYNSVSRSKLVIGAASVCLSVIVAIVPFLGKSGIWAYITTDAYILLVLLVSMNWVVRKSGQRWILLSALSCYAVAAVLNLFQVNSPIPNFLLLAFYYLFAIMLFSRVIELLQSVTYSSITDGLTGLYNRKYFNSRVAHFVSQNIPVSVIFSDIDNFKKLNDTKGHHMGDEMLKLVAGIMKEESIGIGLPGRYGGEEIVFLVADPSVDVAQLAEKIRRRIEIESIVTASIGYSTYVPGLSVEELVKQADEAMYRAKTTGKNKVVSFKDMC